MIDIEAICFIPVSKYRRLCVCMCVWCWFEQSLILENLKFSRWIFPTKRFTYSLLYSIYTRTHTLFAYAYGKAHLWANHIHLSEWRNGTENRKKVWANWVLYDKEKNVEQGESSAEEKGDGETIWNETKWMNECMSRAYYTQNTRNYIL